MALQRKCGILAHPTSFESRFGIGDLGNGTYQFIDFLKNSNQKLWQILPLGPTSFGDSPYQCFSTFAGNHFLISPDELVKEKLLSQNDISEHKSFNEYSVEYGNVIDYKMKLFRIAFESFKTKSSTEQKKSYDDFCKKSFWLNDFSLFMAIKYYFIDERSNTFETPEYTAYKKQNKDTLTLNQINDFFYGAVWNSWPKDLITRNPQAIREWTKKLENDIYFYKFLQYEFFRQWSKVKIYANNLDIQIIGDIPIFVAMDSSDVWANPELFYLDNLGNPTTIAGVPPDYFSATGQLWGNPLYKWDTHKKQGYKWWINRIASMTSLVDSIRIDHFRGFDEYWSVPYGEQTAINGSWKKGPGANLFRAIEQELGELPIIAEDLGILTDSVIELRDELNLPGMKILQFAFDRSDKNDYLPHNYTTSNCIVYTGTHDNDTSLGWYQKTLEEDRDYLRRYLNISGDDVSWDLIRLVWSSVGAYAITPVQDLLSQNSNCRMNTPGIAVDNWQYRFKMEQLSSDISNKLIYLGKLFDR